MTTERSRSPRPHPPRRRPHAAAGGRLLVGGLSLSLLVGLVGSMARAGGPPAVPPAPAVAGPATEATPPIRVPAGVEVTRPTTPPVTTRHGS